MEIIKQIKKTLDNYQEIELVIAFGSVLNKKVFNKNSDIDIAIAGIHSFSSDFLAKLNVDLSVKFKYEFDVVDLNRNSGVILQQALCTGKVIINKRLELYAGLIKKMWYNQADMMPNVRMIWDKRRSKLLYENATVR